jgi:hypothetical protein
MAKTKRRKYYLAPSVQLKYIVMSILPALVLGVFCAQLLVISGEKSLQRAKQRFDLEISALEQILNKVNKDTYPREVISELIQLERSILSFRAALQDTYLNTLNEWYQTKRMILGGIFLVLICVGILSLLYSHRIAGPLYRLNTYIDMLSKGKDIPPVRVRGYDEFKELTDSLERLRIRLKEKGVLRDKS